MSEPLVSIIIPCYNAEKYVGEAIQSALDQTYPHKEVIVIDDGSTDGSLEVIRSFGDRVRWETGPNRGACAARNRGLKIARGEFIQFLDADDLLHTTKLQKQVAEFDHTGADMVICYGEVIPATDVFADTYKRPYYGQDPLLWFAEASLATPAPVHRRTNLERVGGFREDCPSGQERDLHMRLAAQGLTLHQLPELLFTVRRTANSVSSNPVQTLLQHLRTVNDCVRILEERKMLSAERARALASLLARDARALARKSRYADAHRYLARAREIHPSAGIPFAYRPWERALLRLTGVGMTETVSTKVRHLKHRIMGVAHRLRMCRTRNAR